MTGWLLEFCSFPISENNVIKLWTPNYLISIVLVPKEITFSWDLNSNTASWRPEIELGVAST